MLLSIPWEFVLSLCCFLIASLAGNGSLCWCSWQCCSVYPGSLCCHYVVFLFLAVQEGFILLGFLAMLLSIPWEFVLSLCCFLISSSTGNGSHCWRSWQCCPGSLCCHYVVFLFLALQGMVHSAGVPGNVAQYTLGVCVVTMLFSHF